MYLCLKLQKVDKADGVRHNRRNVWRHIMCVSDASNIFIAI